MTAVEWFSNKAYELFEQYSEGKFDRIELNKLMLETTNKAKEMEKEQIIAACNEWFTEGCRYSTGFEQTLWYDGEQYYNETFKSE